MHVYFSLFEPEVIEKKNNKIYSYENVVFRKNNVNILKIYQLVPSVIGTSIRFFFLIITWLSIYKSK